MFSFSSILPQGLWTYLNKTSSNSAVLFTNSVRRQKEKSNSPQRSGTLFFHILFETWQEQNIPRESDRAKLPAMYTWPCFLNYLPLAAPLKEAESVLYVPSHDSCKAPLRVWFFTAHLKGSAGLPFNFTSSVRLPLFPKEIQLDLWQFCQGTNDIFSKAKFVWQRVDSSWNCYVYVCLRYGSASLCWLEDNFTCVLFSGLYSY